MDLRELREFNKNALKSIGEVVSQYPDMSQVVNMYFQQADLPPPPSPGKYTWAFYIEICPKGYWHFFLWRDVI